MSVMRVLVVDDDLLFAESVAEYLREDSLHIDCAGSLEGARQLLPNLYDVLIVDYELPDGVGIDLAEEARKHVEHAKLLLVTGRPALQNAVDALRAGIEEYLTKPVELEVLRLAVLRTVESLRSLQIAAVEQYRRDKLRESDGQRPRDGDAAALDFADRANRSGSPVLLRGETGTGKTRLAQMLHARSPRSGGPFLSINCSAIPESLIESELFGAERGAFTGAVQQRLGVFEIAHGGTLFLDEVGELSLAAQARLLSAIEDRCIRRVGGSVVRQVDVRIVAATHVDLRAAVHAGRFREDLRYRLEVLVFDVPPLRQRPEELEDLVSHWLRVLGAAGTRHLAPGELARLTSYHWPGNIRELRNVLERALLLQDTAAVRPSLYLEASAPPRASGVLPDQTLAELERTRIAQCVAAHPQDRATAAAALGISLATLRRKLREQGVAAVPRSNVSAHSAPRDASD